MAIDPERRKLGLGASEIAGVLSMSPYSDPFSVYVSKVDPIIQPSTVSQRRGHYLERGVAQWVAEDTGKEIEWFDQMIVSSVHPWMFASPDAWIIESGVRAAELQIKTVGWRNVEDYGDSGSDDIPAHVILQCQWSMSVTDKPYTIVAALCGLDDLRLYHVARDKDIEAVIIEEAERFWKDNVLARNPPPIGCSPATGEYLKKKFPRATEPLRIATPEEHDMLVELKSAGEEYDRALALCIAVENRTKLAIGTAGGLLDGKTKATWHRSKDSVGVDWEATARDAIDELALVSQIKEWGDGDGEPGSAARAVAIATRQVQVLRSMTEKHTKVLKQGSRRLHTNWGKK